MSRTRAAERLRVVKERGFDGRAREVWYDRAGRCRETVDAQMKRTQIERDAVGRMVKQVVPRKPALGDPVPRGEDVEYTYDALGRVVRAKNDAAEVCFTRDALGRVIAEVVDGHTIESRYDAAGARVGRRTSLGHETGYDFDGNGGLVGVSFDAGALWGKFDATEIAPSAPTRKPWRATFARDGLGQEVERSLPGGVVGRWEREVSGRPRVHRVEHAGLQVSAVGYRWRSAEQLAGLVDTAAGATWFDHDARGYLVEAQRPDGVQHRAADAVGNVYRTRGRTDRVYARGGRLEQDGETKYHHDEDGQVVEKVTADGKRWGYAWDLAGQLVEVTRPDGQAVRFGYDALGRRVQKTFAGKTTRYVWDGNDLVHEIVEGAAVTWVFEPGSFALLAKIEGGRRYGVVTDHLGTPQMMADEAGALAWKAQLDVYGVARTDVMKTNCPWRWPGQYEDEETGLYYNRFRYYDPEAGRYVSQDPIGLRGGLGLYGYVHDPLGWLDPFGLTECGWSNKRVKDAAAAMERGESSIWVKLRTEAEELFLGKYVGNQVNEKGEQVIFKNTTGKTAMEAKEILGGKANTYHWDDALDELGQLAGHKLDDPSSQFQHLQVHPEKGAIVRIFFGDALW